jgi:HAD superfamily hydrolase (TIGR01509 family)
MRKIEGFVFDVDGTLVDSNKAHAQAWLEALSAHRYAVTLQQVLRYIGTGGDKLVLALTGNPPDSAKSKALRESKAAIFEYRYLSHLKPFPKVPDLLRQLQKAGMRLAVGSTAKGEGLKKLLRVAQALDFLKVESCGGARSKPDPDTINCAVRWLGVPAAACVMVGDSPFDAQAAAAAGVRFIGVRCGGRNDSELQPAIAVLDDPADLLRNLDAFVGAPVNGR